MVRHVAVRLVRDALALAQQKLAWLGAFKHAVGGAWTSAHGARRRQRGMNDRGTVRTDTVSRYRCEPDLQTLWTLRAPRWIMPVAESVVYSARMT